MITITHLPGVGVRLEGDLNITVTPDQIHTATFLQNTAILGYDTMLSATPKHVLIRDGDRIYGCQRGRFVDVARGIIPVAEMERLG